MESNEKLIEIAERIKEMREIMGFTAEDMAEKTEVDTNIYLFLFLIVPFAIFRFINSRVELKRAKRDNNTYKIGVGYITFLSALFSVMEVIAIVCKPLPVGIKIALVVIAIIVLQIIVAVISIIFFVYWFRSLIVNRRSRERRT